MTRVLVFGSSVDHGFWGEEGGWVQRLRKDLDRYSMENKKDYSLYNLSISGDTSRRILERMETEIVPRNNSEKLHIYLEIGGGNDSQVELNTGKNWVSKDEYRKNVRACIDKAEEYAHEVVLFTSTPVDESEVYPMPWKDTHGYRNSEKQEYTEVLEEVADEKDLPLINFFKHIDPEAWKNMLHDGVHPNTEGHRQLYRIAKKNLQEENLIPADIN